MVAKDIVEDHWEGGDFWTNLQLEFVGIVGGTSVPSSKMIMLPLSHHRGVYHKCCSPVLYLIFQVLESHIQGVRVGQHLNFCSSHHSRSPWSCLVVSSPRYILGSLVTHIYKLWYLNEVP